MIAQGELLELDIEDLNHQGEGVGRFNGCVVFVPDTVIGDRILVRILRLRKQYSEGQVEKLLVSSHHRIRPRRSGSPRGILQVLHFRCALRRRYLH